MSVVGRRAVLAGGAVAAGAALLAWLARSIPSADVPAPLLEPVPGPATLRAPGETGAPEAAVVAALWQLFGRLCRRGGMDGNVDLDEAAFADILRLKCAEAPSYLAEYREAARLLGELGPAPAGDAGTDLLLARPDGVAGFEATRLGRLQAHVVGEFLELAVALGGFRAFGYRNYRGFAGGALSDPARPPFTPARRG